MKTRNQRMIDGQGRRKASVIMTLDQKAIDGNRLRADWGLGRSARSITQNPGLLSQSTWPFDGFDVAWMIGYPDDHAATEQQLVTQMSLIKGNTPKRH